MIDCCLTSRESMSVLFTIRVILQKINYVVKNVAQGWTYVKFRTILKISVCP